MSASNASATAAAAAAAAAPAPATHARAHARRAPTPRKSPPPASAACRRGRGAWEQCFCSLYSLAPRLAHCITQFPRANCRTPPQPARPAALATSRQDSGSDPAAADKELPGAVIQACSTVRMTRATCRNAGAHMPPMPHRRASSLRSLPHNSACRLPPPPSARRTKMRLPTLHGASRRGPCARRQTR
jgi:hypothetical protein